MKKLLCLMLIFVMMSAFLTVPSAVGAAAADVEQAEQLLTDLGIITAQPGSEYITRGEFASASSKLLNMTSMPGGYRLPFGDVSVNDSFYEGVCNLYSYRAISDAEAFRPSDNITVNEATKIIVSLLGYDFLALASGGWPMGYLNAANQLGIGTYGSNGAILRSDVYSMMYNALHCKLPTVSIGEGNEYNYTVKGGNTLLYEMWDISILTGTVDEAQYFGTNYSQGVGEGKTTVGGVLLKKGSFDTDALFGEYVDAYYDHDKNVIPSIYSHDTDNSSITKIFSYQDMTFPDNTYSYTEDDEEEEKIAISNDSIIIYNNKRASYSPSIMVPVHGYVKLIRKGGTAGIVIIKSYDEILAGAVISSEHLVADKLSFGTTHNFEDENIVFSDQNGSPADFSDIKENDILWVSKDADSVVQEVRICKDVISGELTATDISSSRVYIDDHEYFMSAYALSQLQSDFKMGSVIKGCINPDGEIVYLISENDTSNMKIAYLMRSTLQENGFDSSILIKVLDYDGTVNTYNMADVFTVNGISFKNSHKESYALLPKQAELPESMAMGIIVYYANQREEISELNYADDIAETFGGKNFGCFKTSSITDVTDEYVQYKNSDYCIMGKAADRIFVEPGTKRFIVPEPSDVKLAGDSDYKVETLTNGYLDTQRHTGYTTVENDITSKYVVSTYQIANSLDSVSSSSTLCLVTGISKTIDEEGNHVEKISLTTAAGKELSYYSTDLNYFSKLGISFGDLVKISADVKGKVSGVHIIYRAGEDVLCNETTHTNNSYTEQESKTVLTNNSGMGTITSSYIMLGRVYKKSSYSAQLLLCNVAPENYAGESLHGFSMYNKGVAICDTDAETFESGTAEDLKAYADFGGECSKVVVETGYGTVSSIFVYK